MMTVQIAVKIDLDALSKLNLSKPQLCALMSGIAQVVAAQK
jgi:hypothetical protein